jgi:diaminopimelate epimerase
MKRILPFDKYEATGNDFIILDFFEFENIDLENKELIRKLCDRHFGIGADGLIALQRENNFDFRMRYFNSDGNLSSFCGNGSRASLKYMATKHPQQVFSFIAEDGNHEGKLISDLVSVKMKNISNYQKHNLGIIVDSGSPHLIIQVNDPWDYPVISEGRQLRDQFGIEGINVNFVSFTNDKIRIATYERGVESETLACGTGVTAAAYYKSIIDDRDGLFDFDVEAKGGLLNVSLDKTDRSATNIWLSGQANRVFSGFYDLDS